MSFQLFTAQCTNRRSTSVPRRAIAALLALAVGPALAVTGPCASNVVISQVYGGGGNTGATYSNDFVELHNPGATPVSLAGWAIQYASTIGTSWTVGALPSAVIPAGGYYLIQGGSGGATGSPLPAPDASVMVVLAAGAGKIALTSSTTVLSGSCPLASTVDFVGYGPGTDCSEGGTPAPAPSATLSVKRLLACGDTNQNSVDFAAGAVAPRNGSTQPQICECTVNGTGAGAEMDYCVLNFPASINVSSGVTTPSIFTQVYEMGLTETAGANPAITAQIGYGAQGIDPSTQAGFTWTTAVWNLQQMNNDEYMASFTAPAPGTYKYASRLTRDGVNWTYCDMDGAGSNGSLPFSTAQMGTMTVESSQPAAPQITSANNTTFHPGVSGSFTVTATGSPTPTFAMTGTLPSGVNFDAMSGILSGPPAAGTAGGYPLTFTASNSVMPPAVQNFALVVTPDCTLDADGNGTVDALTDGLMMLRAMFGLTGTSVTNGAIGPNAGRNSWTAIRAFLNLNCGTTFAP